MVEEVRLGPAPRDPVQRHWDPEMQTMDPGRRRALQDERLRAMVAGIFERPVPLFGRVLAAAGVGHADEIRSVDDLASIPLTVKHDLRESEAAVPPFGDYRFTDARECVRVGTSTGTTGTPTLTLWTRRDLWIEHESAARVFWRYGQRPGMIATHAHPAYLYGGGPLLSGAYEYFGFLNVWVPPPDTDELAEQALRFWARVTPDIPFVGFSTGRFLEVAARLGIDPAEAGILPKPLPGFGLGKGMPLMTAGGECYAFVAGPCGESPGAHVHEDWAVVQAVDPQTGREVPDGEWGDLVVTTLGRDNGLVRYDLEEACAILREPCPCGETTIRAMWGGRFADLLTCQGKRLQPNELEVALRTVGMVAKPSLEYVVVRPRDPQAPLVVRVECTGGGHDGGEEDVEGRLVAAIRDALGVDAQVEVLGRGTLPRSGYKTTHIIDE